MKPNKLTSLIRKAEKDYFHDKLKLHCSDHKAFLNVMRLVLSSDKANSGNIGKLIVDRSLVSDQQDIVNSLNNLIIYVCSLQRRPPVYSAGLSNTFAVNRYGLKPSTLYVASVETALLQMQSVLMVSWQLDCPIAWKTAKVSPWYNGDSSWIVTSTS